MRTFTRTTLRLLACTLGMVLAAGSGPAAAQEIKGPVRILVGYPAGGTADAVARLLAEKLKDRIGQPVVVDNRVGAGGQIAAEAFKAAAPNGNTILLANTHMMVTLPLTMKSIKYDPLKDFAPIGLVANFYDAFVVANSTPAANLKEYIDYARKHPDQASFGIPAPGSLPQFFGFRIGQAAGIALTPVPYKGGAPLTADLLGGQIPAGVSSLGEYIEHHKAGKLKVVAVNGSQRSAVLPNVPTLAELGYKDLDSYEWLALYAPAGTARPLVERLNHALREIVQLPEVRDSMLKLGTEARASTPDELGKLVQSELAKWRPVVKASGYAAE